MHYKKDYPQESTSLKAFIGQKKTLTCTYENAKSTDTYHWYSAGEFCMTANSPWSETTKSSLTATAAYPGTATIICEVVNAKGDVVFVQTFTCKVMRSLRYTAQNAVQNSWLYGVTEYSVNHIRWNYIDPVLNALGVETY